MNVRSTITKLLFYTLLVSTLIAAAGLPLLARAVSPTASQHLAQAWQRARSVGQYTYQSTIVQTLHPTTRIENAGRAATVQRLTVTGQVDAPAGTLTMRIRQGGEQSRQFIDLKFEHGRTYGRVKPDAAWTELDERTDLFAPGGDLMGFLNAAQRVRVQAAGEGDDLLFDELLPSEQTAGLTRYVFELNGLRYAQYLRDQTEEFLRRKGELAGNMHLALARTYIDMAGSGELWVAENGLPVRLLIQMKLPPAQGAFVWKEVVITTDFSDWHTTPGDNLARLWQQPSLLVTDPGALAGLLPAGLRQLSLTLTALGLLLLLTWLIIRYRHSPRLYAIVVASMILALVIGPLLQAHQVSAASQRFYARQSHAGAQQDESALQSQDNTFNPLQDPLIFATTNRNTAVDNTTLERAAAPGSMANSSVLQQNVPNDCDTATDSDCDGVPNSQDDYPNDPTEWRDNDKDGIADGIDPDDDNDHLSDAIEAELGTNPLAADSDGDFISDWAEVKGFPLAGRHWYLDPLNPDSNGDGFSDTAECSQLVDIDAAGKLTTPAGTVCADLDNDTTPDVFDFDNDGDGVPDKADTSPSYAGTLTTAAQSHFNLTLTGNQTGKPLVVEFDVRPDNPDHLWVAGNVLDWPANDRDGQIRRIDNSTFLDQGFFTTNPKASNGDMMVQPMLELTMPYSADNVTRGLPKKSGVGSVNSTTPLDDWLDKDRLGAYGVTVSGATSDTLRAYVPLHAITDPYAGDSPVAWSARMYYQPEVATWGSAHAVRLLWMVTVLSDRCDTSTMPAGSDYDSWCADDSHWVTNQGVAQIYYDDFHLTGLSVKEEHGMNVAVIAQKQLAQGSYAKYLWHLSDALQQTFLKGLLKSDSSGRFDVNAIVDLFGPNAGGQTIWGVPTSQLAVVSDSAPDQSAGLNTMSNSLISQLLSATYPTVTSSGVITPTLLIARENSARTALLQDAATTTVANTSITVDVSRTAMDTFASLQLTPYTYDGVGWTSENPIDYLDTLQHDLDSLITTAELQTLFNVTTVADPALAKAGVISLAKSYFMALAYGVNALVAVNDTPAGSTPYETSAVTLAHGEEPVLEVVADVLNLLFAAFVVQSYVGSDGELVASTAEHVPIDANSIAVAVGAIESGYASNTDAGIIKLSGALAKTLIKQLIKLLNSSGESTSEAGAGTSLLLDKLISLKQKITNIDIEEKLSSFASSFKNWATILSVASVGVKALGAQEGWDTRVTYGIALGIDLVAGVLRTLGALQTIGSQIAGSIADAVGATAGREAALVNEANVGYGITFAVGTLVNWGLFLYTLGSEQISTHSLAFGPLLAETIARTILAIGELLLQIFLPGIGELIVAVVTSIDLLIADICKLAHVKAGSAVDTWVCGGISGAITEAIVKLIYDQYIVVDLTKKDRLGIAFQDLAPLQTAGTPGFAAGNQLQVTVLITNTIKRADPSGLGGAEDFGHNIPTMFGNSAFTYTVEPIDNKHTAALNLGDVAWTDISDDITVTGPDGNPITTSAYDKLRAFFTVTGAGNMVTAGINQASELFLNESWWIPALDCWGFIVQGCARKDYKSYNPVDLGDDFVFDLFPATFDEFYALAATGNASYRLVWDDRFPTLADADGDQLRSKASGGLDPDDGTADQDGDGLADRYELSTGTDPAQADSDGDGLSDYWELFYRTNPLQPDSDFDGLPDGAEFFHTTALHAGITDNGHWQGGWSYVYGYDSNNHPLATAVSANPLAVDSDGDGILDEREQVYGFNPNVPSELHVLTLNMNTSASRVQPGATVAYTASIHNDLRAMYEDGLLQTEFPVDHLLSTRELGVINPRTTVSLTGQVAAPQVSASQSMSLTVRAGVVVDPGPGRALLLRMNDPAGSTLFRDASYNDHNAHCTTAGCPQANGNYTTFSGNSGLAVDTGGWQNFLNSSTDRSFTINIRAMGREDLGERIILDWEPFSIREESTSGLRVQWTTIHNESMRAHFPFQWTKRWSNLTLSYDANTRTYLFYINGTQQGTYYLNGVETSSHALVDQPDLSDPILVGHGSIGGLPTGKWSGEIDQLEVFPRVLDAQTIRALYGPKPGTLSTSETTLDLRFDESPGQDHFTDALGNTAAANCAWLAKSCPDSGIPGRDNQALRFDGGVADEDGNDGVGDYLQISADTTSLDLHDSSFTVMVWIKPDNNLSGERAILGNDGGGDFANLMLSLENGRPRMAFGGTGSTVTASGALSAGQWHHVAFQYNKDTQQQQIFVNGQQVASASGRSAYLGTNPILVGRARGGNYFDGLIDDLVIVNRALFAFEIQTAMQRAPLVNLHLDEDQGAIFHDDSPSQHHATCQGGSCPAPGAKGQIREAPVFDGGDRLTITGDGALNLAWNFSIALWVKPTAIKPHVQTLLQKHDGSGSASNFNIWTLANSLKFKFDLQPSDTCTGNGVRHVFSNGALLEDQWNHIMVTYDGSTLTIYLNGAKDSSATFAAIAACSTGNIVTIGDNFTGGIDEVSVYGALLSDNDVRTLFDYQSSWYDTTVQRLITVDADNPQVAFEHDGQYLPNAPGTLWLRATDATSPIAQVAVSYSGPNGASGLLTPQLDPYSAGMWYVDFAPSGAGSYHFQVTATDRVGHASSANGVVHVDTAPPTIALAPDLNGATVGNSAVVALNGTLNDPGTPSSGVVPNAVVVDLRDVNGVSLNSIQHAVVTGGLWQAEFPLPAAAYGSYNVWASVADGVGNVYSDTIGSLLLDDVAPLASVVSAPNVITQIGTMISGTISDVVSPPQDAATASAVQTTNAAVKSAQIRFRHASGSVWPQLDPALGEQVVFYAPFDTKPYSDLSAYGRPIETVGSSSDALLFNGRSGGSIFLRGASALKVPNDPAWDFDKESFTVATWVYFELNHLSYLVNKNAHGSSSPGWGLRFNENATVTFEAVSDSGASASATTPSWLESNEWHHLVAVVDGEAAQIRLYVDGALSATAPWAGNVSSSTPLIIGGSGLSFLPSYYLGALDDLVIFDRALTNAEASLLAQAETWHPVTLAEENVVTTNWHYVFTDALEGPYKIDLWTEDTLGNRQYIPNAWSGEIDTLAPRVALNYVLSADKSSVEISCAAADYNLALAGWVCPVNDGSLTQHDKDAHWFTAIFSDVQKLAGLSTGVVITTPAPAIAMTACDSFGHCTSEGPTDTDGDGIPDHVEGEGDRDGDGILDAHDYDPDGHFYELGTGKILPGGRITVSGPAPVAMGRDGSDGYYEWTTAISGVYTLQVTPPRGYIVSPDCPPQPGPLTDAAGDPLFLGASEFGHTGVLTDGSCATNPYYLSFDMEPGVGFFFNNNIPLTRAGMERQQLLPLIVNGVESLVIPGHSTELAAGIEHPSEIINNQTTSMDDTPPEEASAGTPEAVAPTTEDARQDSSSAESLSAGSTPEHMRADGVDIPGDSSEGQEAVDAVGLSTKDELLPPADGLPLQVFLPIVQRATNSTR